MITVERNDFVGYEYKEITVSREMENIYIDAYQNFGWKLEGTPSLPFIGYSVNLKFKRDRKVCNKAELTRLQHQFEVCVSDIDRMKKSKAVNAAMIAYSIGLAGTAFLAGAVFAYLNGMVPLCIILAIPGFAGWALPYFCHNAAYAQKSIKVNALIDNKYDEIFSICEKGNGLLQAQ